MTKKKKTILEIRELPLGAPTGEVRDFTHELPEGSVIHSAGIFDDFATDETLAQTTTRSAVIIFTRPPNEKDADEKGDDDGE